MALLALRLPHLGGPIDDPHSWRQCDTAHYARDFDRRGIDLFHPRVCWMGGHGTLILEFPVTEAGIALLHRTFGYDLVWDRVVALALFVAAAAYAHAFARMLAGVRVAWISTLVLLLLPLGQFYSRTAHVDFGAIALGHAFMLHGWIGIRRPDARHLAFAAACGTVAAMIKAPSLVPLAGPMAVATLVPFSAGRLGRAAVLAAVPAAGFAGWWRYVESVNRAAPDWSFLPDYYKGAQPASWYLGSWGERLDPRSWLTLGRRLVREIATPVGIPLALFGIAWAGDREEPRATTVALAWCASALAYLALFITLNTIHNYYQLPLLAPASLMIALGIDALARGGRWRKAVAAVAVAALLAMALLAPARLGYYRVDWLRVEAGRLIDRHTPPQELVVACDHGSEFSDPRLLFRADREGWAVSIHDLEPGSVTRLRHLGAAWVAVVTDPAHPALEPPAFLEPARTRRLPIEHAGATLGELHLFDLRRLPPEDTLAGRP